MFPCVWLFGSYGGWRALYTLLLEPATGYPLRLAAQQQAGRLRSLAPGEILTAEVRVILFHGVERVERITPDGEVSGVAAAG